MTDSFQNLKNEMINLYPDLTEAELNSITNRLIEFYAAGIKAVLKIEDNLSTSTSSC